MREALKQEIKKIKEEIIIYVCNDTLKLLCLKCLNDFMNEEIFDRVKIDLIAEVRKVLKEGK